MVELRWAVPEHTTTQAPRLQYRQLPAVVSFDGPGWTEWQDVPFVVVQQEPPKPTPTVAHVFGVMAAPALLALIERYAVEREEVAVEAHAFPGDSWKNKQPAADATLTQIRAALGVAACNCGHPADERLDHGKSACYIKPSAPGVRPCAGAQG